MILIPLLTVIGSSLSRAGSHGHPAALHQAPALTTTVDPDCFSGWTQCFGRSRYLHTVHDGGRFPTGHDHSLNLTS